MLSILITQFVVLWAVIDPIGSVPVYLSQTQHLTAKQRRLVALKAVAIATGVLLFFLVAGQLLLEAMQIPLPAFQAAVGLLLLLGATHIQKWIGNVGAAIISRVMGLILAAVAVNNLLVGIKDFYL